MMSALLGNSTIVTGVEDGPEGMTKVYVGHRSKGYYILVSDPVDQAEVRRQWGASFMGHLFMPMPPLDAIFHDRKRPYIPPEPDLRHERYVALYPEVVS